MTERLAELKEEAFADMEIWAKEIAHNAEVLATEIPIVLTNSGQILNNVLSDEKVRAKLVDTAAIVSKGIKDITACMMNTMLTLAEDVDVYRDMKSEFIIKHPKKSAEILQNVIEIQTSWQKIKALFPKPEPQTEKKQ